MSSAWRNSISSCFQHGLQDGYLSLKPHVKGGLFPLTLARTGGGGGVGAGFFTDSEKRRRVAPSGFGVSHGANLAQLLVKKNDQVRSGHGVMTS